MVSFILLKKFLFYVKVIVNLIDWLFFDLYLMWFLMFILKCILYKIVLFMWLSLIYVIIFNLVWYK